ncbi:MAG: thioredoxin domain-containing protein [Pseudomonadota bacterium]
MPPRPRLPARLIVLGLAALLPLQAVPAQDEKTIYTNRLIDSHDPYLLQHAHNPVDWYPWGAEALDKARRENKPIFISVGYSTCYWCHVAEREIYSNPQIAELMNQWFVNIKIDREERPDLDQLYMLATQAMTGRGGWPNNVFLTPNLKPFFAGSYFPPNDQNGRPGFPQILTRLHQAWIDDRDQVVAAAERVYKKLQQPEPGSPAGANQLPAAGIWLGQAVGESAASFDNIQGGFGDGSTKFPKSPQLSMLLAAYTQGRQVTPAGAQMPSGAQVPSGAQEALEMAAGTLEAMAEGGVMDQLGAGFHRYSTEPSWSIPHFEKMLYDNAQLLGVYAQAYALTKKPLFRQVALRTARYLTREMQAPGGGFYSAQDAEAAGVEGASYLWTREQIESVLGAADARRFFTLYALTPMPDAPVGHQQPAGGALRLKGHEARKRVHNNRLDQAIDTLMPLSDKLLRTRQARLQPQRDEKIVIADNALAIMGFAQAGKALQQNGLTKTAVRTADWMWQHAFDPGSGELKHQFYRGQAAGRGFLDDYGLLGQAFMSLYRTSGDRRWQSRARQVAEAMLQRFSRPDGSLSSSWDTIDLLVAPPVEGDSVKPSGHSAAIALLLELSASMHEPRYAVVAHTALTRLHPQVDAYPSNWGGLLASLSEPALRAALDGAALSAKPAIANSMPNTADHVHARGHWVSSQAGATLVLTIKVDDGFHINANPASDPYLIATQLLLEGHPDVNVKYPAAQSFKARFAPNGIDVYQGRITLQAHLPSALATPPPAASLRVQACNDEVCLAPATLAVPLGSAEALRE